MHNSRRSLIAVCTAIGLLTSACAPISSVTIGRGGDGDSVYAGENHHHGPPPHAPAHGHRHQHRHQGRDLELVFDSDLGVYVVVGIADRYYWNGHYIRIDGEQWYASVSLQGGWELLAEDSRPRGSGKRKQKKHSAGKKHGPRNSSPAKGHW
ncbi:MAG: hypothetical protein CL908_25145 [Deltaproteobacteria bacterium]|nr:hypothetical protein [Deltaproteobacteria bacterium]